MNSKFIASALIAAASLASASAFAAGADGSVDAQTSTASALTRAEVRAAAAGTQQGAVTASNLVDGGTLVSAPIASARNRSDVRAEAVEFRGVSRFSSAPGRG